MNLAGKLTGIAIGITGLTVAIVGQPDLSVAQVQQVTQALSPEQINLRAKQITVRIDGTGTGSGVILEKADNTYTVLTNWHVVKNPGEYTVQTIDGRQHSVDYTAIKRLSDLDLAIIRFSSNQNYQLADKGNSAQLVEGQNIYFAGYPGELRQENNRYYRFFPANLVGVLPKSSKNGYSLIYNGEAFPGMSGGPVLDKNALLVGIHGEANIHALTGATSNYAIPINSYQQAIANNNPDNSSPTVAQKPSSNQTNSTPTNSTPENQPNPAATPVNPDSQNTTLSVGNTPNNSTNQPDSSSTPSANVTNGQKPPTPTANIPPTPEVEVETNSATPSSTANQPPTPTANIPPTPEVEVETNSATSSNTDSSQVASVPTLTPTPISPRTYNSQPSNSAAPQNYPLISTETGIDYTPLRNLLAEGKWEDADHQTYDSINEIVKTAKRKNTNTFIELRSIADFACNDIKTIDRLWQKYSNGRFGFSPQQQIWSTVNQKGDFSTETWRNFATVVGWKQGDIASSSGYLLYEQLTFDPQTAPVGHLPWWFASTQEQQNVIKHTFTFVVWSCFCIILTRSAVMID